MEAHVMKSLETETGMKCKRKSDGVFEFLRLSGILDWSVQTLLVSSAVVLLLLWSASAFSSIDRSQISNDSALYQSISEIKLRKSKVTFERDVHRLARVERKFQEKLPHVDPLKGPVERVRKTKYRRSRSRR